jgi:hypothetical protein
MRYASEFPALIALCLIASPSQADETAREIIERGMKARCEKIETLEKQRCEIITMQGKIYQADQNEVKELPATGDMQMDWPSSWRWNRDMTIKGGKMRLVLTVQNDKGWMEQSPQSAVEMNVIQLDDCKMEIYGRWLATLYPLKDKAFTFMALKNSRVGDEDVSVVKVMMRLRPDVYLSFSKKSGHLVKVAYRAREAGVELRKEHVFSDYKPFDGLLLPTKMIDMMQYGDQRATKSAEWTITGYKFVEKLSADTFAFPQKK